MVEYEIEVTQDFIDQREERLALYNTKKAVSTEAGIRAARMRIDHEVLEWHMINIGEWEDEPDDWRVDAFVLTDDGKYTFDVKFIKKWYNIANQKLLNYIDQRGVTDAYAFYEWVNEPTDPLSVGDRVNIRSIGVISYDELRPLIKVSRGKWGGYYADVRGYLAD